jgi:hypothetical protein
VVATLRGLWSRNVKDWWKKRKDKKSAKKTAKADAKAETAAVDELGSTGVMTQPLLSGPAQPLGSDTANRVYKTDNKASHAFGNGETTGYFKPDQSMAPAKNAVAASRVAKGLGMDDIIPETRFASLDTGNGLETGALSANARGEALHSNVFDTDITDRYDDVDAFTPTDTKKRKGDRIMELSGTEMNDVDLSRPNTQSGLNRLQWFDALTGNMDRHGANILVDPKSGNVSGIDNDLSFDRGVQSGWGEGFTGGAGHFSGLPDMIDADTAERLLALDDAKIKELLQTDNKAAGLGKSAAMTDKDVKETVNRLKLIQAKVKAIKADVTGGNLVQQWDQSTYDKQLNAAKHKDGNTLVEPNYIARHAAFMDEAKDTSKPLIWQKGTRAEDTTPQPKPQQPQAPQSQPQALPQPQAKAQAQSETAASKPSKPPRQRSPQAKPQQEQQAQQQPKGLPQPQAQKPQQEQQAQQQPKGLPQPKALDRSSEDEASEDEKDQVADVVGQTMSAKDALLYIDDLIAELEDIKIPTGEGSESEGEEQAGPGTTGGIDAADDLKIPDGGMPPLPPTPTRPPVPNVPTGESEDEKQPVGGPRARRKSRPKGMRLPSGTKLGL